MKPSSRAIFSRVSFITITLGLLFTAGGSPASSPPTGKPGAASIRGEHVPDEILVKFRPSVGKAERDDVRSHMGAARLRGFRSGAEHWKLGHGQLAEEGIARLRANPHVEYAEPNYLIHLDRLPNDPRFPELWGLRNTGQLGGVVGADIHAESAWNVGTGSRNVLVAVIDTGIDYTHPDLVANIWTNPAEVPGNGIDDDHNGFIDDVHGYDFVNHDSDPRDDNGHGTHVSGTIGAVGNDGVGVVGVNWQVSLVGVKFLSGAGFGTTADAIASVDYAALLHVSVMNASWGGGGFSQALYDAIGGSGALFVAAAGNDGQDNDIFPHYPSNYDLPNIIAVAATNRFDQKAGFSDWGATTVDLGAPGVDILSTVPGGGYGILSGTSMATPHVSGAAALVRAAAPGLGILQIKQRLLDGADRIPALAGITVSGGRLNAFLPIAEPDTVPPGAITDLYAVDPASNSIALTWTATGDDGAVGTASFYDLRYATTPIDEAGFASATQVQGEPAPAASGSAERFEVTGLDPDTIYYFAIKAMDEWGNAGPLSLVASTRTLPPPTLSTSPASFYAALLSGQSTTLLMTIENAGVGTLDWSIPQPGPAAAAAAQVVGAAEPEVGAPVIDGRGGPDASGYLFIDSDEPGGPTFAWTDIASSGTLIGELTGDERTSGPIPLGFQMPFYGQTFDSVRVSTNGYLSFTSSRSDNVNLSLPSPGAPGNLVAPFWDDLDFRTSGTAVYAADADSFTIQYTGVGKVGSPGLCTFQVTLYRNGEIAFRYLSMSVETRSSTVGIQNADGTIGLGIAFNGVYVHDQLAVRFTPPAPWLSVSPTSGRLAAGERRDVTLTFNAEGLEGGHYETPLFVESNDPLRPRAEHSVALDVTGAPAITVRPASLEFGTVFSGFARTLELTVENIGTDLLTVSEIVSVDPAVTVAPSSMTLLPHASGKVAVTYAPLSPGTLDSSLTISSDASNTPTLLIGMTGVSGPAPEIGVVPTSYSETLLTGGTTVRGLTISNGGGSDLVVHLTPELVAVAAVQGMYAPAAPGALALPAPELVNGGFESGDFSGWTARSNGREELISWRVTRAGEGWWGNSHPVEGVFDALNGFDGVAGLEYELYQNLTIPYGTIDARLTFLDRIQFDSLGIPSAQPRIYEATIRDESGGVLDTFVHEEILLNGRPYTDRGWQERSVDLTPYVGRTVRLHIREYIPETYTGPATIEFDNFRVTAAVLPEWLKVLPSDAVIAPGGSASFDVVFDADSLDATVLVGSVRLDTNIPDAPVLRLPATLTVVGAPNLKTAQDRLDFGEAYVGFGDSLELTVLNQGPEPLQVTRIDSDLPEVVPSPTSLNLPARGIGRVTVTFTPSSARVFAGGLRLESNDPDTPVATVPLTGMGVVPPDIDLTPGSFGENLFTGETAVRTLSIANNGGSDLAFRIEIRKPPGADSAPPPAGPGAGPGGPGSRSDYPPHKLPATGTNMTSSPGTPPSASRQIYAGDAGGILVYADDVLHQPGSHNVDRALQNLGLGYTAYYNDFEGFGQALTSQTWDLVIVDHNNYYGLGRYWDELESYIRSGGSALITTFDIDGSDSDPTTLWATLGIVPSGDVSFPARVYKWSPNHPLFSFPESVPDFTDITDVYSDDGDRLDVSAPSEAEAGFAQARTAGEGAIVLSGTRRAIVNGFLVSENLRDLDADGKADAVELLENEIAYLSGAVSWLSIDPIEGVVPAGESVDVTVTFDATGLFGGDYDATLALGSNDPDEAEVTVPAHLHVTGAPDIAVSESILDYGPVFIGGHAARTVTVANHGTDTLTVSDIRADDPTYTVVPSSFVLAPGDSQVVTVTFAPDREETIAATLTIASDDPDNPAVSVALQGAGLVAPDIGVSPSRLDADLFSEGSTTQTLHVENTGGSDLTFSVSIEESPESPAAVPIHPAAGADGPAPAAMEAGAPGMTASSTAAQSAPSQSALSQETVRSSAGAAGRLLLLATTDVNSSVVRALNELDRPFDLLITDNFASVNLSPYDVILVAMDGGFVNEASVQALANAAAAGKALVMLGGTNYQPYYQGLNSFLLGNSGMPGWKISSAPHWQVVDASHRLARELPAVRTFVNTVASFYMLHIDDASAGLVARNGDGWPILIHKRVGRGRLVYFTNSPYTEYWRDAGDYALLKQLVDNALKFSGAAWLSADPISGTVPAGGAADIAVKFDATGLFGGDYDASLVVGSNDPDEAEVRVPAHLHVTGAPAIAVSPVVLDYGPVFLGGHAAKTVTVANNGTDTLAVSEIRADDPTYTAAPSSFALAPGGSQVVTVTFTPDREATIAATLIIASNDPDDPEVAIALSGVGQVPPEIDVSPTSFTEALFTGGTIGRTLTIRNTGRSDLVWEIGLDFRAGLVGADTGPAPSTVFAGRSLEEIRDALDAQFTTVTNAIPNRFNFSEGETGIGISDGGNDMYDGGNFLETNLGGPVNYSNGAVVGSTLFGLGGRYFTRKYPGLFVLAADLHGIESFHVFGDLGADGSGTVDGTVLATSSHGIAYQGFVKRVYNAGDPSVNHLIIVARDPAAAQTFPSNTDNDDHLVSGLSGVQRIYYLLYAGANGSFIDDVSTKRIMDAFLATLPPDWLQAEPASGVIPAGGSVDVTVTFDAAGLFGGDYDASLVVGSNDPDEAEARVPAHLHVTGAPAIVVSPGVLDYGPVFIGGHAAKTVTVANNGTDTLTVSDIRADDPTYTVAPSSFTLAPGGSQVVTVTFTPDREATIAATLTIASNDPDDPAVTVALHGVGQVPPDIGVSPSRLDADLFTDGSTTQTLHVENTGGSDLTFSVSIEESSESPAAVPIHPAVGSAAAVPAGMEAGAPGMTASSAAAQTAPSQSAPSQSAPSQETVRTSAGAAGRLLLLTTTSVSSSVVRVLNELNRPFDFVLTDNFASVNLSPYDVIMVAMDGGSVSEASVQALANAAADGKKLVMLGGTNHQPYYQGLRSFLLGNSGTPGWKISNVPHWQVVDASHRLARGLPAVHTFANVNAAYYMLHIDDASAGLVARNGDGWPILIHKRVGRGQLVYFTNSPYTEYWTNPGDYALLKQLVDNALRFSGAAWLNAEPNSGTVPAGGAADLAVTFDATGLFGGDYDASLVVGSNDPDEAEVSVPAHLHVTGAPAIVVTPVVLDYGPVFIGGHAAKTVTVANNGTDTLTVSDIRADDPTYTAAPSSFALAPGGSQVVTVTFTPDREATIAATLTIASNDPDDPAVTVALHGVGQVPPDIGVSPSRLDADLFTDGSTTQTLHVENTGGSDLTFSVSIEESSESPAAVPIHPAAQETVRTPAATGGRLLLLANTSVTSSVARALNELNRPFDFVFTDNFAGVNLSPYDVIVVAIEGGSVNEASVQALANAAAGGKALVMLGGTNHQPYYQGLKSFLLGNSGMPGWKISNVPHWQVVDASHRLASGLPAVRTFGNVLAAYYMLHIDDASAGLVARNGDGWPILIHKRVGRGRLVYFTSSPASNIWTDPGDYALLKQLVDNALKFSGAAWLNAEPISGTVPAGGAADIAVKFDATGLFGGDYDASLVVGSNDPDEAEVRVPAHLHVTGAPAIVVSPGVLDYGPVFIGGHAAKTVTVANNGTDTLAVSDIRADDPTYTAAPSSFALAPGGSQVVTVTFAPDREATIAATLTIASNDPDDPAVTVALTGAGRPAPVVDAQPRSMSEVIPVGQTRTRTVTLSNTGGSPLDFVLKVHGELPNRQPSVCTPPLFVTESVRGNFYAFDPARRALRVITGFSNAPNGIALDPARPVAYVVEMYSGYLWSVDLDTGVKHFVTGNLYYPSDVAIDPLHRIAYVTESMFATRLQAVDLTTGAVTTIASLPGTPMALDLNALGTTAYVAAPGAAPGGLVSVNLTTGAVTPIPAVGLNVPDGIALSPDGSTAYVTEQNSGELSRVNLTSGQVQTVAFGMFQPHHVVLDTPAKVAYVSEYNALSSIDLTTGIVTRLATGLQGGAGVATTGLAGCSGAYLRLDPLVGSIDPHASLAVSVVFDTAGYPPGDYQADIEVTSNDPVTPSLNVHTTLAVVIDGDGDGVFDPDDNCPRVPNPGQEDADGDRVGDVCDNCPTTQNAGQLDTDFDGIGDACDPCTDTDRDGAGDPGFPGNTCPLDNCLGIPNPDQADFDGDGMGDFCDPCTDTDRDGLGNPGFPQNTCPADNCPTAPNPTQADVDHDGLGDACDPCPTDRLNDTDHDGTCAGADNCPTVANPGQDDTDGDGVGDVCDICPAVADPGQTDTDNDGIGDACDRCPSRYDPGQEDGDGDGRGDLCDNCPDAANPDQADSNHDGAGDACQPVISLSAIRSRGSDIEVEATAVDPQGERLTGSLGVFVPDRRTLVLQDLLLTYDCALGFLPDGIQGQGIGYTNASIGAPYLYDLDLVLGCTDSQPDYVLASGACDDPQATFDVVLSLAELTLPAPICVRPIGAPSGGLGLIVEGFDDTTITVSTQETQVLRIDLNSGLPSQVDISSLVSGRSYRLVISLTDGHTPPVRADGVFEYHGETRMVFVTQNSPPVARIGAPSTASCTSAAGGPVTLDASTSSDADSSPGTNDDIIAFAWVRDPGTPAESPLGLGRIVQATLPLGPHTIGLVVTDSKGATAAAQTSVTVRDTVPPSLTLTTDQNALWPPNHRVVPVHPVWQVSDACDPNTTVRLVSATSSEPDDAPGTGDGATTHDVDGAEFGTADGEILLRAERAASGPGRTYVLLYRATDASGNSTSALEVASVPRDLGQGPEPLSVRLEPAGAGMARVYWNAVAGAQFYDLITGDIADLRVDGNRVTLGNVRVPARLTTQTSVAETGGPVLPPIGHVFFYVVQYRDAHGVSGFGTESASRPLEPLACEGGCPGSEPLGGPPGGDRKRH